LIKKIQSIYLFDKDGKVEDGKAEDFPYPNM